MYVVMPKYPPFASSRALSRVLFSGIAVSHPRFYSRVNPARRGSLILQCRARVKRKTARRVHRGGGGQANLPSPPVRFSCTSYGYRIVSPRIRDDRRRNVGSPLVSDRTVALLDVAVVYRFRFSRGEGSRAHSTLTLLLPFHPPLAALSSCVSLLFLAPAIDCLPMLYSRRGRARLGRASSVGIRYAINDGLLLSRVCAIDTLGYRHRSGSAGRFRLMVTPLVASTSRRPFPPRTERSRVLRRRCNAQKIDKSRRG